VYETFLPSYAFESSFDKSPSGDVVLKYKLTQGNVDKTFAMPVPIYLQMPDGKLVRLGSPVVIGNSTVEQSVTLTGLKQAPKRAMVNYNYDVLASN